METKFYFGMNIEAYLKTVEKVILMKDVGDGKIYYEDAIIIYGGALTGIIISFAKRFYKHRHKRWQIVAKEKPVFLNYL